MRKQRRVDNCRNGRESERAQARQRKRERVGKKMNAKTEIVTEI